MKKFLTSFLILALALGAVVSLTSCGPDAGLEEISFEEIAKAKLYDTYSAVTTTKTYKSDNTLDQKKTTDPEEISGAQVKVEIAAKKVVIDTAKALSAKVTGKVCANKDYSKIVAYVYTRDSNNNLTSEAVTTYKKK